MEKIELKVHKPPKQPRMTSVEETIQLARIQQAATTSALYERKHNQKALKVLTVAAYILFVSMAAITLSFYYVFIWDPSTKPTPPKIPTNCDYSKTVISERLAIRLANNTEISAEHFLENFVKAAIQEQKKLDENHDLYEVYNINTKSSSTPSIIPTLPSSPSSSALSSSGNIIIHSSSMAITGTTTATVQGGHHGGNGTSSFIDISSQMNNSKSTFTIGDDSNRSIIIEKLKKSNKMKNGDKNNDNNNNNNNKNDVKDNNNDDDDDDDDDDDTEVDGDYEASGVQQNSNNWNETNLLLVDGDDNKSNA